MSFEASDDEEGIWRVGHHNGVAWNEAETATAAAALRLGHEKLKTPH